MQDQTFKFGKIEKVVLKIQKFCQYSRITTCLYRFKENEIKKEKVSETISSQKIRILIQNGQLNLANDMLGRNWCITGKVERGKQQGREIGFPTANLSLKIF